MALISFTATVNASDYVVKGQLMDSTFNESEPFVTYRIYQQNNTQKAVAVNATDENGYFIQHLNESGNYKIEFSAIGREELTVNFSLTNNNRTADLKILYLKSVENELEEVTISARKPLVEVKPDKLVYDIEEDPASKTNTVIEILRKVPMVTVDGDDNIKVNGSSDFKIYVNGTYDPLISQNPKQVLKALPASSIKYVEVITEPGAKYDAEGTAGILNIITQRKETTDGILANLTLQGSNRDANGTIYTRVKKGDITVGATYSYYDQFERHQPNTTKREDYTSDIYRYYNSNLDLTQSANVHVGDLQLSFEPDTLNLFTLSSNIVSIDGEGDINGEYEMQSINNTPVWSYESNTNAKVDYLTLSVAASYQHTFKRKGHNLTLSYLYNHGKNNTDYINRYFNFQNYISMPDQRNEISRPSHEHTFQIDYTNPFAQGHTFESGGKYIMRRNKNYSHYYSIEDNTMIYNDANSVDLHQYQDILALYASYLFTHNKFGLKAGVRYEYTDMGINFITPGYESYSSYLNDLVPNMMLSYTINAAANLRLNYQMRITRPNVELMNPYINNESGVIKYGNPNLESMRNNEVSLSYSDFGHFLGYNFSVRYGYIDNLITDYSYLDNSIYHTTYDNLGSMSSTSFNGYLTWGITPKMRFNLNGGVIYSDYRCKSMDIYNSGWSGNIGGDYSYDMPWKLRLNAYGGYGAGNITLQGKSTSWNYYGISISKKFMKEDRLVVSINANQFLTKYNKYTTITETDNFRQESTFKSPQWRIGVSVTYRFGNLGENVKKTDKSINNDDIQQIKSENGIIQ